MLSISWPEGARVLSPRGSLLRAVPASRRGIIGWRGALKLGAVVAGCFSPARLTSAPDPLRVRHQFVVPWLLVSKDGAGSTGQPGCRLHRSAGVCRRRTPLPPQPTKPASARCGAELERIRSKEFFRSCVLPAWPGVASVSSYFSTSWGRIRYLGATGNQVHECRQHRAALAVALATSLLAATSEEFIFRLFAIPFLHRLTVPRRWPFCCPPSSGIRHSIYPSSRYARASKWASLGSWWLGHAALRHPGHADLHYTWTQS